VIVLKKTLNSGGLAVGGWITLAHPAIAEIMARSGFDFVVVDLEHSVSTISDAGQLIRIIDLCGVAPLVRVTSNDANQIKRVMDAGAHGIIIPMLNSAEEARRAVSAVRYPVKGTRGVGLGRAQGYGVSFHEYRAWLESSSVVIAQIEHVDAVEALEDILSVEGIDGYIIGPYDLSASMGLPGQFEHPHVVAAMERINRVGKEMNKPGGVHIVEPDPGQLRSRVAEGFRFIAYSVDFRIIDVACRQGLAAVKEHQ
jgi:2-dehydro-3-deoxyglucarate aldolase